MRFSALPSITISLAPIGLAPIGLAPIVLAPIIGAPIARADDFPRLQWPLRPVPPVTRAFDAPRPNWQHGHRGVDLAGSPGQPVYPAGAGTVVFAGLLAGRAVVSVAHPGGLRTSYEPVESSPDSGVRPGRSVEVGTPLGRLLPGHPGCSTSACLHWGAMWGPASRADYVDPLGLLTETPIHLKPLAAPGP